ncbi:MAG: hypothetical protein CME06_04135 [Gemmatimonadetes bacterium]|nr:hypothetical protein [Gemmatimonadota bacterium]
MRIALVEDGTIGMGGIRRYQRELVRVLAARREADLEFVLYTSDPLAHRRDTGGIATRFMPPPRWLPWHRWVEPAIRSALAEGAGYAHLLTQAPVPALPGIIVTLHDLAPLELAPPLGGTWARRRLFRHRLLPSLRRAARIVVDGPSVALALRDRWGVPEERIAVIAPGIAAHFQRKAPRTERAPFVLAVLGAEERKGEDVIRRAWDSADAPRLDLLIVGGRKGGTGDQSATVKVLRDIDDQTLSRLYSRAAAVACPSWAEGFGFPALEAMAHGTPVVATSIAAFEDLVGDAGILVPPGDSAALSSAIGRISTDRALALRLGERGRRRAARFTWERAADELVALYKALP